jgi:hypothetical protein
VSGRVLEDLAAHRLRFGDAAGLMQRQGAIARLGKVISFSLLLLEARVVKRAQPLGIAHVASAAGAARLESDSHRVSRRLGG